MSMQRRGFLKMLGLAMAGTAVGIPIIKQEQPEPNRAADLLKAPVKLGISSKGSGFLEKRYVFAPYVPFYTTPPLEHIRGIPIAHDREAIIIFNSKPNANVLHN